MRLWMLKMLLNIEPSKIAHKARLAILSSKGSAFDASRRLGAFWRLPALSMGGISAVFGRFSQKGRDGRGVGPSSYTYTQRHRVIYSMALNPTRSV